jgi:hypothetical protein
MRPETLMLPDSRAKAKKPKDGGKVRRPPNSFILFTKEWRSKLATQYPEERNTDISMR